MATQHRQQPQPQIPVVKGMIHQVPCPWCGMKLDLREMQTLGLIDVEGQIDCFNEAIAAHNRKTGQNKPTGCGQIIQIHSIQTTTLVAVFKSPRNAEILNKRKRQGAAVAAPGHRGGAIIRRR